MRVVRRAGYALGLPVILVLIWWLITKDSTNLYYPPPQRIAKTFWTTWITQRFMSDVVPSIIRLALGVIITIALGILLGLLIGTFRRLRQLVEPLLEFFRAIPPPVLVPLLMLLVGINDRMKIAVIVSGAVWPVLLNTVEGVRARDEVLDDTARTYALSGLTRVRYIVLPAASPQILAGIRQSSAIALILMVISEMFGSSSGLGFTIVLFQQTFAIPQMWSGIFVLGFIGIALYLIFQIIERRVLHWYYGQRESQRRG